MTAAIIVRLLFAALSIYMLVTGTLPFSRLIRSRGYQIRGNLVRVASICFLIILLEHPSVIVKIVLLICAHIALVKAAINTRKRKIPDKNT